MKFNTCNKAFYSTFGIWGIGCLEVEMENLSRNGKYPHPAIEKHISQELGWKQKNFAVLVISSGFVSLQFHFKRTI